MDFDRNLFHSFEIETTNNFDNLNFSGPENVNSTNSDFANFLASLNYSQPDCILGTESWLDKDTTSTSEIFPPEYQVLRKD